MRLLRVAVRRVGRVLFHRILYPGAKAQQLTASEPGIERGTVFVNQADCEGGSFLDPFLFFMLFLMRALEDGYSSVGRCAVGGILRKKEDLEVDEICRFQQPLPPPKANTTFHLHSSPRNFLRAPIHRKPNQRSRLDYD